MADFPFEIVGFDLDGTLLDTHADLGLALNHALAQIGRGPIPVSEVTSLIGGGSRLMLDRALEVTGGPSPMPMDQLYAHLLDYYEANIAVHTRLYPGGAAMLDALAARGVRLAVVTNKLERLAVRLLDALDLSKRLFAIIGGDTLGPGRAKPAPDLLYEMITRAGLSATPRADISSGASAATTRADILSGASAATPRADIPSGASAATPRADNPSGASAATPRAAYVGDTSFDTDAARAAGIPCVAVSFGFCDKPPRELGADAVIDHYDELVPALQRL